MKRVIEVELLPIAAALTAQAGDHAMILNGVIIGIDTSRPAGVPSRPAPTHEPVGGYKRPSRAKPPGSARSAPDKERAARTRARLLVVLSETPRITRRQVLTALHKKHFNESDNQISYAIRTLLHAGKIHVIDQGAAYPNDRRFLYALTDSVEDGIEHLKSFRELATAETTT